MATLTSNRSTVQSSFIANRSTVKPQWFVIDATDKVDYTPHADTGDFVIVVNVEKIKFTGKKWEQKSYQTFSHYAGGQKIIPAKEMRDRKPEEVLFQAVKRMISKGPMGYKQLAKVKIYKGPSHEHQAQQPVEYKAPKS